MKISGLFRHTSVTTKALIFVLVVFLSIFVSTVISQWVTGGSLDDTGDLKLAQLIQSVGLFVLPPLLLAYLWSDQALNYLHVNRLPNGLIVFLVIIISLLAIPAVNLLGQLNHAIPFPDFLSSLEQFLLDMEKQAEQMTRRIIMAESLDAMLFNVLLIAVVPAIGEELFFRGIIQQLLQERVKMHAAVWITALVFSSIHFQFFGFIPRILLGAWMGYLFVWTQNLWVPIAAHFMNNCLAVVFYYFYNTGRIDLDLENIGTSDTYFIGILSAGVVSLLILLLKRHLVRDAG